MNKGGKKLQLVLVRLKGGALLTFYILFDETSNNIFYTYILNNLLKICISHVFYKLSLTMYSRNFFYKF